VTLKPSHLSRLVAAAAIGGVLLLVARAQPTAQAADRLPVMSKERALAFIRAAEAHLDYLPGEVLIKFRSGVSPSEQQAALSSLRSRPSAADLRWIGEVALLRDNTEPNAPFLAQVLRAQPEVEFAEPNYLRRFNATPRDPSFSRQWNFTVLDLPRAWDINPGGNANTVVAVLDSGVTTVNQTFTVTVWTGRAFENVAVPFAISPDLSSARLTRPVDFANPEAFGINFGAVVDMDGHGTHVASTIGEETNNDVAEAGVAYSAKIMPVKVCVGYWDVQFAMSAAGIPGFTPLGAGGCPVSAIASGLRYAADNGANAINMSLGGPTPSNTERDALTYAVGKGAFIAVAGGNEFEEGNPVEYPAGFAASIDGAMSVAAVGRSLRRAFYSNTGSHIEIAAPGGDDRDGGLDGLVWQATILFSDSDPSSIVFPRFDRYGEEPNEGTSMASPHVAGVAALLFSQGVTKPSAIEALLRATALDKGSSGRDNEFGFGVIQPRVALRGVGVK
jgi:serine protease